MGFVEANGGRVKDQYQSEARTDDVAKALPEQLSKQSNLLSSKKDRPQDPLQMHEIIERSKPRIKALSYHVFRDDELRGH